MTFECVTCLTIYPLEHFWLGRNGKHRKVCRDCINANKRKYFRGVPSARKKRTKTTAEWKINNKERVRIIERNNHLLKTYGITLKDYESLFKQQDGVCRICSENNGSINLDVDHCHVTGKIRGLLCRSCNVALGKMKDSPKLLRNAALYLEQNSEE